MSRQRLHRLAPYDEPDGIRDQLYAAARRNPQPVKLEVLGHTGQGREIIAVKLTQGAQATGRQASGRALQAAPPSTRVNGSRPRSTGG